MAWTAELGEAFAHLEAGRPARVTFADRGDTLGEIGREFNALAADWRRCHPAGLTREQAHRLRNRLAGILSALHMLRSAEPLSPAQEEAVDRIQALARQFDARLRARRTGS